MPTKQQRRALSKTLEQSGLGRIDTDAIEWLAFAEPTPELNKRFTAQLMISCFGSLQRAVLAVASM